MVFDNDDDDKLSYTEINQRKDDNEAKKFQDSLKKIDYKPTCGCIVIDDEIYSSECNIHETSEGEKYLIEQSSKVVK